MQRAKIEVDVVTRFLIDIRSSGARNREEKPNDVKSKMMC